MEDQTAQQHPQNVILSNVTRLRAFLNTGRDPGAAVSCVGISYDAHVAAKAANADRHAAFDRHTALNDVVPAMIAAGEGSAVLDLTCKAAEAAHLPSQRGRVLYVLAKVLSVRVRGPLEEGASQLRLPNEGNVEERVKAVTSLARRRALHVLNLNTEGNEMMAFFHLLNLNSKRDKKSGLGGRGNRQLLSKWFNQTGYIELALTSNSYFTVKDLIKIGHIKGKDEDHKTMIKYFMHGFKSPKGSKRGGPKAMQEKTSAGAYLEELYKLKTSARDPTRAVAAVRKSYFPLSVIPSEVRYEPEVARAVLQRISVRELIANLHCFTRAGFLQDEDDECTRTVAANIRKEWDIRSCKILPAEIEIARRNILLHFRRPHSTSPKLSHKGYLAKGEAKKKPRPPSRPLPMARSVFRSLRSVLPLTFQNLPPLTCRSVLVCVDNRPSVVAPAAMCKGAARVLNCLDAMVITVMSLVKAPKPDNFIDEDDGVGLGPAETKRVTVLSVVTPKDESGAPAPAKWLPMDLGPEDDEDKFRRMLGGADSSKRRMEEDQKADESPKRRRSADGAATENHKVKDLTKEKPEEAKKEALANAAPKTDPTFPLRLALEEEKKFDAFIFLTSEKDGDLGSKLNPYVRSYREKVRSGARFVFASFSASALAASPPGPPSSAGVESALPDGAPDRHKLVVAGFDREVPSAVIKFASGEF